MMDSVFWLAVQTMQCVFLTKALEKCWESKLLLFYFIQFITFKSLISFRYSGHKTDDMTIESAIITNDNYVISGSKTGEMWCWDLVSAQIVKKYLHTYGKVLNSLTVHPTKDVVLTASVGTIKIWGDSETVHIEKS